MVSCEQACQHIVVASHKSCLLLEKLQVAIVMLTVIIFFSTLVYFLERDEPNTTFTSIPAAFWWCLFSQTKYVPQSTGKDITACCEPLALA